MQQLTIAAYRTHADGRVQITISQTDENGCGTGYRLAGPKHYNSGTTELASAVLTAADASELRHMLDAVFPPSPTELRSQALTEAAGILYANRDQINDNADPAGQAAALLYAARADRPSGDR